MSSKTSNYTPNVEIPYAFDDEALQKTRKHYWETGSRYLHRKKTKYRLLISGALVLIFSITSSILSFENVAFLILGALSLPLAIALLATGGYIYGQFCQKKGCNGLYGMESLTVWLGQEHLRFTYRSTQAEVGTAASSLAYSFVEKIIAFADIDAVNVYENTNLIEFFGAGTQGHYDSYEKEIEFAPLANCYFGQENLFAFFLCLKHNKSFLDGLAARGIQVTYKADRALASDGVTVTHDENQPDTSGITRFAIDTEAFNKARKAWIKQQPLYKALHIDVRKRLRITLCAFAVCILLNCLLPFTFLSAVSTLIFIGILLSLCHLWFLKLRCAGDELSIVRNPQLYVTENSISFGFDSTLPRSNEGLVYHESTIALQDIEYVIYHKDTNLLEFFGSGIYSIYTNRQKVMPVRPKERRRFGAQYAMRFFLCLDDNDAFLEMLHAQPFTFYER